MAELVPRNINFSLEANKELYFTPSQVAPGENIILSDLPITGTTDENGTGSVTLYTYENSFLNWFVEWDGSGGRLEFTLADAPTDANLGDLLNQAIQSEDLRLSPATVSSLGMVKPDGVTITIDADGTIHSLGGGSGVTDHGSLTGLGDDDHAQYFNQTRGDARYVRTNDARLTDARTPTGGAGGVLSGNYPNPGFAVDMVEQSEFNSALANKADLVSGKVPSAQIPNLGVLIENADEKETPVNADVVAVSDSESSGILKKLSLLNLANYLIAYFDTIYQSILISGASIKTINGESVLGSGDLEISSGGSAESPLFLTANDAAETSLKIGQFASQSAAPIVVEDSSGNIYLLLEASGYQKGLRLRGGYDANGVVLNESGLTLVDTGYGANLSIQTNPSNTGPAFSTNRPKFNFNKDIYIADASGASFAGSLGIVLQSPNGTFWRITVDDLGQLEANEV